MLEKKYKSIPSKRSDRSSRFQKQLVIQIVREVEEGLPERPVINIACHIVPLGADG